MTTTRLSEFLVSDVPQLMIILLLRRRKDVASSWLRRRKRKRQFDELQPIMKMRSHGSSIKLAAKA